MILYFAAAGGVFALCAALRRRIAGCAPRPLAGAWARLEPLYNRGAAFGRPVRRMWLLNAAGGAAAAVLTVLAAGSGPLAALGAGTAVGGGAANLYERLRHRRVLDYLRFPKLPGRWSKLVFNAADLALFVGLLLTMAGLLRRKTR